MDDTVIRRHAGGRSRRRRRRRVAMHHTRTNEELLKMEGVGVRIDVVNAGWVTTVVRFDKTTGTLHEETWPVRVHFELARLDARRFAPRVRFEVLDAHGRWRITMCERRLMPLAYGTQIDRGAA